MYFLAVISDYWIIRSNMDGKVVVKVEYNACPKYYRRIIYTGFRGWVSIDQLYR